jgi:branched-chain amino acid transport system substrate-binding protein
MTQGEDEMKKLTFTLLLILLGALLLVACGTPAQAPSSQEVQQAASELATQAAPVVDQAATVAAETAASAAEAAQEAAAQAEAAAAAAATAAAEAAAPALRTDNLEGETITIYHFGDLSGPYAAITSPLINGMQDAVNAVNANGGIRGATIEVKFIDTGGSVDESVSAYERFTGEDANAMLMFTYGSPEVEALASRFAEDKIVNLSAGLSAVGFYGPDSGYTFGLGPIYPDQFGLFLDWLTANWADVKPAGAGDEIKLAHISWPGAFGQGALTPETRAYAAALGVEIVTEETYDLSPTADTTTALLTAQAAGANVLWTNTLAFGPAALMNGIGALGLQDQFVVAGANWGMDVATFAFVQDPALAAGFIAPFPSLWWNDADHPGIQKIVEIFTANSRTPGEQNAGYLIINAGVDLAVSVIEMAIDEVGFDALNGEAIYNVLTAKGPFEPLDGVLRLDYSDGSRSPHVAQIRQIQGGPAQFNVLQDWTETPDLRPEFGN